MNGYSADGRKAARVPSHQSIRQGPRTPSYKSWSTSISPLICSDFRGSSTRKILAASDSTVRPVTIATASLKAGLSVILAGGGGSGLEAGPGDIVYRCAAETCLPSTWISDLRRGCSSDSKKMDLVSLGTNTRTTHTIGIPNSSTSCQFIFGLHDLCSNDRVNRRSFQTPGCSDSTAIVGQHVSFCYAGSNITPKASPVKEIGMGRALGHSEAELRRVASSSRD